MNFRKILMNEAGGGSAGEGEAPVKNQFELTPEVAIGLLSEKGYKVYQSEEEVKAFARTLLKDQKFFSESVVPIFENPESDFHTAFVEKKVSPAKKEVYERFESDVHTLTGIEKKVNEKTHEYLKRAYKEVRTGDLTKIESLTANGNQGEYYEKEMAKMERQHKERLVKLEQEKEAVSEHVKALTFEGVISGPLAGIRSELKEKGFTGAALEAIVSTEKNKLATLFRKGLLKQYESSKEGVQWQIYRELEGGVSVPANNDKGWPLTLGQFFKDALESYGADVPNRPGANIQEREIVAGDQKSGITLNMNSYRNLASLDVAKGRLLKDLMAKLSQPDAQLQYKTLSKEIANFY